MQPEPPIIAAAAASALDLHWGAVTLTAPNADVRRIDHRLIVHNSGPGPRIVDAMADLVPELVDANNRAVPLPGGRNRAAPPSPVLIPAGGSAAFAIRATLQHIGGGIDWRGADGLGGRWETGDFNGSFRLRIRVAGNISPPLSLAGPAP